MELEKTLLTLHFGAWGLGIIYSTEWSQTCDPLVFASQLLELCSVLLEQVPLLFL